MKQKIILKGKNKSAKSINHFLDGSKQLVESSLTRFNNSGKAGFLVMAMDGF